MLAAPYGLDGSGVNLFVFDAGAVLASHVTFDPGAGSRVTVIDGSLGDRPRHPRGGHRRRRRLGLGGGRGRGVATGAKILSAGFERTGGAIYFWDNAGDIEADYAVARNDYQADLGTNSL